jgi:hypothetical protein
LVLALSALGWLGACRSPKARHPLSAAVAPAAAASPQDARVPMPPPEVKAEIPIAPASSQERPELALPREVINPPSEYETGYVVGVTYRLNAAVYAQGNKNFSGRGYALLILRDPKKTPVYPLSPSGQDSDEKNLDWFGLPLVLLESGTLIKVTVVRLETHPIGNELDVYGVILQGPLSGTKVDLKEFTTRPFPYDPNIIHKVLPFRDPKLLEAL